MAITFHPDGRVTGSHLLLNKPGSIIQTVTGTTSSRVSSTSTGSWVDTTLKTNISLTNANNNVLIMIMGNMYTQNTVTAALTVFRGGTSGTNLEPGSSPYGLQHFGDADDSYYAASVGFLDTGINTTNSTEYLVKIRKISGNSGLGAFFPSLPNRDQPMIQLMEIVV